MISPEQLSAVFVEAADSLVDDFDVVDFLQTLTTNVARVSGADAVGLMLADGRGRLRYMASSNEGGKMMEMLQLQTEEGPCLDCFHSGRPVVNVELGDSGRWPRFGPLARAAGYRSVHAFPMRLRAQPIGALNLFGALDEPFEEAETAIAQALADVATIALVQERTIARADALAEQLQGALNSRIVIEQAKGALAQVHGTSPNEAFEELRRESRSSGRRLAEVAADAIERLSGRPAD